MHPLVSDLRPPLPPPPATCSLSGLPALLQPHWRLPFCCLNTAAQSHPRAFAPAVPSARNAFPPDVHTDIPSFPFRLNLICTQGPPWPSQLKFQPFSNTMPSFPSLLLFFLAFQLLHVSLVSLVCCLSSDRKLCEGSDLCSRLSPS